MGKFLLRGSKADTAILRDSPSVDVTSISWDPADAPATDTFATVYFPVIGDGQWRTTYGTFQEQLNATTPLDRIFNGTLTQIRMYPATARGSTAEYMSSPPPIPGTSFHIDWIRLANSPVVTRVTGCNGETYSSTRRFTELDFEVTQVTEQINTFLDYHRTAWKRRRGTTPSSTETTFARSYNCLRTGGERITIEGRHLGNGGVDGLGSPAIVLIGQGPCTDVQHDPVTPQSKLTCTTPAMTNFEDSFVHVLNGKLPGLNDSVPFFQYARHPPAPTISNFTNNAARSIDLTWKPGGSIWDAMTATGYIIYWRQSGVADSAGEMTVGNVTTTTVRGLNPDTVYEFSISAISENQNDPEWEALDKYGRRNLLPEGLIGGKSAPMNSSTLAYDLHFTRFDANATLSHGAEAKFSSTGPTGVFGGEGHYGLHIIGDANIENCNASVICCDSFDPNVGPSSCASSMSCSSSFVPDTTLVSGIVTNRRVPDNLPGGEKWVKPSDDMLPKAATMKCGPALRLTASSPRLTGAAWYKREMEVGEGFDTTFTYRISNPSLRCNSHDDVYTHCRSRGADGFAFVLQANAKQALGGSGQELGYGGIVNSLAIEFDTFFNPELLEPYENHISVHTRGWRDANSANQTYSLGHTNEVPDLTDGDIKVRIKFDPNLDETMLFRPQFQSSPFVSHFLENADFPNGGMPDWGVGFGMLQVYVNDLNDPVLIVPLSLEETLHLNHGRSWVGFTSATGFNTWQVHDILDWHFTSLRLDRKVLAPPIVNGDGSFSCSGVGNECVHK